MHKLLRVFLGVFVALIGARAFATSTADADRKFIGGAAAQGLAASKLGQLAIVRGVAPEVKALGRRMVDDQAKLDRELRTLAKHKSVSLPTSLPAKDRADIASVSRLTGNNFDRAFLKVVANRQQDVIDDFETEAGLGTDPDVRRFAKNQVTVLRAQHDLAKEDRTRL
jgi:putative membrane protein